MVLRPEPGLSETMTAARARGLDAIASPLFAMEPVAWRVPAADRFDGLLLGSANAIRQGGAGLSELLQLPVYAVGERTAEVARSAGFTIRQVGCGGLQSLLNALRGPLRLLRLAGAERVALDPPHRVSIEELEVYRTRPIDLSQQAAAALRESVVAMLHSAAAARRFAAECERLGLEKRSIALAALAPAIAGAAGAGWQEIRIAPSVSDAALLALTADMCQNPGR